MVRTGLDRRTGSSRATMSKAAEPPAVRMIDGPANRPSPSHAIAASFTRCISAPTVSASRAESPLICSPS